MSHRTIEVDGIAYQISLEDKVPSGARVWALVRGHAVDELRNQPPAGDVTLESDVPFSFSKVTADSVLGVVGIPRDIFPWLGVHNFTINLIAKAKGYIPSRLAVKIPDDQRTLANPAPQVEAMLMKLSSTISLSVGESLLIGPSGPNPCMVKILSIGPGANEVSFEPALKHSYPLGDPVIPVVPDGFAPTDIGEILLHREPVVIGGRVVKATGKVAQPIVGANVSVTGIWRKLSDTSNPKALPLVVSLRPPLYLARRTGATLLASRNITFASSAGRLIEEAHRGSSILRVRNMNFHAGDHIRIDTTDPDLTEYLVVKAVPPNVAANQPIDITLTYSLARTHHLDAFIEKIPLGPRGPDNPLASDAIEGDTCVLLQSMNGLSANGLVEIHAPGEPSEYHGMRIFSNVQSNSEGYFRLPALSRVAQVEIEVEDNSEPAKKVTLFSPNYNQKENQIDFDFP